MSVYKIVFDEDIDLYSHIEELKIYHKKALDVIQIIDDSNSLEEVQKKISDGEIMIPPKPKSDLCDIFKENLNQHTKKGKTNADIHSFLIKLLVPNIKLKNIVFPKENDTSEIFQFLISYNSMIKKHAAYSFYLYAAFGYYLDIYFNNYKNINMSWKKHLKQSFNISESHGRLLRTVGRLVNKFPKLKLLSISLRNFYKLHISIEKMLEDSEYSDFWKNTI